MIAVSIRDAAHLIAHLETLSAGCCSSNLAHWSPWTNAPAAVVREEMPCAPCPGYTCAEFGVAECIRRVSVARVTAAIERVLEGLP